MVIYTSMKSPLSLTKGTQDVGHDFKRYPNICDDADRMRGMPDMTEPITSTTEKGTEAIPKKTKVEGMEKFQ